MRLNKSLLARLNRLNPSPVGGGVLFIEDLESGAIRLDELPQGRAGYLLMPRPCTTVEEWLRAVSEEGPPPPPNIL